MTLNHHQILHNEALKAGVLVAVEVHKRWDPIYTDAHDRIQNFGPFSYIYSYMSQPKHQLDTFRAWAGKSSDISYYLNSHHIDFHEWCVENTSRPIRVTAYGSTGVAKQRFDIDTEDTITLTVQWENLTKNDSEIQVTSLGTAVYTSSWIAPPSDVHSQQRFFYMGQVSFFFFSSYLLSFIILDYLLFFLQKGEINVDQAHRGYNLATDETGYRSANPLFMKYTPTNGKFSGQLGYGYR